MVEESYVIENIKFDINYYVSKDDKDLCYLLYQDPEKQYLDDIMDVVELTCDTIYSINKIEFNNSYINIPENPEAYLKNR